MKLVVDSRKVCKEPTKTGIVYLLFIELEDKQLVKVGMTNRKIQDRVVEILTAIWVKYRYFPRCYVKRFRSVDKPAKVEKQIHDNLKEFSYKTEHRFAGSTEFFDVCNELAAGVYDSVVCNKTGADGQRVQDD